jgi:hypothetical protein
MTDNKIYIDKVTEKFPDAQRTCRPAIVFHEKNDKQTVLTGFIVGDKYFIEPKTLKVYEKSIFYLINYMDEIDVNDD